jgi:hypothetical protein
MPRPAPAAVLALACLGTVVVGVALATHLPYVAAAACEDADAAVVTLMGRHFAHGEPTVFYWGQRYMGALEPWLLAPLAWAAAGSLGIAGNAVVALALTSLQLVCVARIARRLRGSVLVALVVGAAGSSITAYAQTALYGGRLAATTCAILALDVIQGGRSLARAIGAGTLFGVALYGDHLMVVWAVPIAFEAYRARKLPLLAIAALPWFVFDRVFYALTAGPKPGIADPWEWPRNVKLLVTDGLPLFFGADWLARSQGNFVAPPASPLWVVTSLGTLAFAIAAAVWLGQRARRLPAAAAITVVPVCAAGLFLLGAYDVESTRYLPPVWPAVAIAAGVVASARPILGAIGAAVTALNMTLSVNADTLHAHGAVAGRACRAELDEVAAQLTASGVQGVWADYWDAYRMAVAMDERIPFAPLAGMNRQPAWVDLVRRAHPVGYLLSDANRPPPPQLRAALDATATPTRFGRFALYVLPTSLPELPPSP